MVLSGETIKKLIKTEKIKIEPYNEKNVGSISVDLHLGTQALNPDKGDEFDLHDYHLSLDEFLLSNTEEKLILPANIMARIVPRSSLARLGILLTFDADILPPNYQGKPVLTIKNLSRRPVLLKSGIALCQAIFEEVDKNAVGYKSSYTHTKPELSKLEKEM